VGDIIQGRLAPGIRTNRRAVAIAFASAKVHSTFPQVVCTVAAATGQTEGNPP
jgi:hypothetical protein